MMYRDFNNPPEEEGEIQHTPMKQSAAKEGQQTALQHAARSSTARKNTPKTATGKDTMPENKSGWRKKIQSKPKELQPLRLGADETVTTDDLTDRRRHHGWRMTIQASRPPTPVRPPTAPAIEDTDEARDGRATCATPRRNSKPKLTRYTSLFSTFKDAPKGPEFAEPWDDHEPEAETYADPVLAIQAVRSHMISYSMKPIPIEHNNGLFRVFEAYHKLRARHEHLLAGLKSTEQELEDVKGRWVKEERRYAEEVRRLELLIAQGTTGVAGVLHARQGSVIDRKRMHRKTISNDGPTTWNNFVTQDQLDEQIRMRSHRVLLQRPTSPSGKMVALSRQFTGTVGAELRIGTPPSEDRTLSRKVQSELNLAKLIRMDTTPSIANSSLTSGFSGGIGDPLPDELSTSSPAMVEMTVECDAFLALHELGVLVARRRGIDAEGFVNGLLRLLSEPKVDTLTRSGEKAHVHHSTTPAVPDLQNPYFEDETPRRTLRRFQSQPQLTSDQKRRRHFSFDPGEDHLQALKEDFGDEHSDPSHSEAPQTLHAESPPRYPASPAQTLSPNTSSSKIPSPVAPHGSLRQQSSLSSLKSSLVTTKDGRHNSPSSIRTAFRDMNGGVLRPSSSSRSSSYNLRSSEPSPSPKDALGDIGMPNSIASLAAAKLPDDSNRAESSMAMPDQ
ncbi:hypothetical protein FB567DRAFT_23264 [Paraphoma chrysanthemicola]|uniref:Uncharacterized protein n=1 Tax=Paraphoma chrysanthemicola TaxID=798071 RepID=A0A8K0RIR5_9PLEO|nr:hypothetical protein FB567DRAFT_23264 [Paraphoma chrysanthemicola]